MQTEHAIEFLNKMCNVQVETFYDEDGYFYVTSRNRVTQEPITWYFGTTLQMALDGLVRDTIHHFQR